MMTRSLSPSSFVLLRPHRRLEQMYRKEGEREGEKEQEGEERKKRVGWYVQHVVRLSTRSFRALASVAVGRPGKMKRSSRMARRQKTKHVLLATLGLKERETLARRAVDCFSIPPPFVSFKYAPFTPPTR